MILFIYYDKPIPYTCFHLLKTTFFYVHCLKYNYNLYVIEVPKENVMATSPRKIQGLAVLTINEDLVLGAALKMMNECKDFKVFHSIIFLTLPYLSLFTFFSLRVIFCLGSVYMCMEFRIYNV